MAKPTDADIGAMMLGEQPAEEITEQPPVDEQPIDSEAEIVESDVEPEAEPTEQEESLPTEQGESLVEFEIDGQLYEAPKAVADSVMRNNVFTQKTQELAAQRKQYEVGVGQIEETRKAYEFAKEVQQDTLEIAQAKALVGQYEQYLATNVRDLTSQDVTQVQLEIRNMEKLITEKEGDVSRKQQEFQQAQEQALSELLNKSTEVLRSSIPTWGDSHESTLQEYGLSQGFTEQEIRSVVDPRQKLMLWKASQYDKLQDGKAAAVKKAQNVPSIKAKSRNPMPKDVQDDLNFRKKMKSGNLTPAEKKKAAEQRFAKWAG